MSHLRAFKKGGIHPPENKAMSAGGAIEALDLPKSVIVPLIQHIGAPAKPVVKKGEEVKTGQVIAEPGGFVSAYIHSPVTGKVLKLVDVPTAGGDRVPAIEIMCSGEDEWAEGINPDATEVDWSLENDFLDLIKKAGVVGMGGAAFPTQVKLSPPPDAKVETLVINGAECEPYLTSDYRMMLEYPNEIIAGIKILMKILKVDKALVGIEDNKPDAYEVMKKAASGGVEVHMCRTMYPQGAEKQLIEALTGRKVPAGKLPFSVGVVVQNVGTAFAVFEAIARNKPLIERVVTVTGKGAANPGNYLVRLGTPVQVLLDKVGSTPDMVRAMVAGGPMMGRTFRFPNIPIVKASSGILLLSPEEFKAVQEQDCIRCGRCVDACPMGLIPCDISNFAEFSEWESAKLADDCVECGCCQSVCPSKRFLVQWIRLAKAQRRKLKK
jgi:H+/Na+-translocating ferredoxin:NAD+ oxidoreductase subunit C